MSGTTAAPTYKRGIVKQITSGDTIVIRKNPTNGPPPEKILVLSGITAPRLARQRTANNEEVKEEPFAWEAREFLRKLLVGKEVIFTSEKPANSAVREYGCVWAGLDPTTCVNVTEALVAEGLVKVRDGSRNIPHFKKLVEIEENAKSQGKGVWGKDAKKHVRDVKWSMDNIKDFVTKMNGQPIKAIVEYVRDGSTVRLCLLPEFQQITMMISGIRCPQIKQDGTIEPYAEEARYIVESHLLQKEVDVILEGVNNNNFVGTILHPQGNIAEILLKYGVAKCVDWSLALMASGVSNTLRAAERSAKESKRRMWVNYVSNAPTIAAKDKEFSCTVMEVLNGDALVVKLANNQLKKIFLASVRQPQRVNSDEEKNASKGKNFRPLYDIPWMFEAREFLRKRLIGKKVSVIVDYIQPAKDNLPEKTCCTVMLGGTNVAEALLSAGLGTVVRYRNDNDQRSSHYDALMDAESKAQKAGLGVHSKKEKAILRVQDTSADVAKSRKFLPFLKRAQKADAIVEFVASGSRMRLYLPKESVIVTFLLAGISCPRGARPGAGNNALMQKAEPFGEEALQFTKEKCLQHDVHVSVEDMDKVGNFIGWLWVDNENFSLSLVENGLASMHHTAETSEYARQLKSAEENAKQKGIGIWKNYVEVEKDKKKVDKTNVVVERVVKYETVIITEITPDGSFFAQNVTSGPKLEALMNTLRQELESNAPLPGAFSPKKGSLCAARFSLDKQWYRARIEKVSDSTKVQVFYFDYGNREVITDVSRLAALPSGIEVDPPYATEYVLCCVKFPQDPDDKRDAVAALSEDTLNKKLNLNVEIKGAPSAVTLVDPTTNMDLGKNLIKTGLLLMDNTKDRRLQAIVSEYRAAQDHAKNSRLNLWRYGDITEDDDAEFGSRR